MFGRMQVRPFNVLEGEFWSDQFESTRLNVYIQRAVEAVAEVESA